MKLNWQGPRIVAKAEIAAKRAIDKTTAEAAIHARDEHDWENRTSTLEGSLQMRPAEADGTRIAGLWGSFDVSYAALMEFLQGEIMGDTGNERTRPGGSPYLRPARDAEYPKFAARLSAAMHGRPLP